MLRRPPVSTRMTHPFPTRRSSDLPFDELAYRRRHSGRQYIVVRSVLLQHQPHAFDIFAGMAPIALGIEIADIEHILLTGFDGGNRTGDLARHECLAAQWAFMIEQDAVRRV